MSSSLYSLAGKKGLILGIANDNSIAFGCARLMRALGAEVVATCLNDKARKFVEPHTQPLGIELVNSTWKSPASSSHGGPAAARLGAVPTRHPPIAWAPCTCTATW